MAPKRGKASRSAKRPVPGDAEDRFISDLLINVFDQQQLREGIFDGVTPGSPVADVNTHAAVYDLGRDEANWRELHTTFTGFRSGNLRPWYRCLSVLRGLGAVTAIVETHYVCLDWRSEVATFYAYLDAPRKNYTIRIHFFGRKVTRDQIANLTTTQRNSYLGYMVLREGELPLVGRSVLQLPRYMDTSDAVTTAITEQVHFFGQDLKVRGVPFMQQDNRFAVCAHLVAWMAHYTSFRRGILERRLIADFVTNSANVVPMRPNMREGLLLSQVTRLFRDMGLRCIEYATPMSPSAAGLPKLPPGAFPELAERVSELLDVDATTLNPDSLSQPVQERFQKYVVTQSQSRGFPLQLEATAPEILATDAVLAEVVRPYLESRLPVYLGTTNHALLLCGFGVRADQRVHFVHDDLNGPYLVADSLINMSRESLVWQSGFGESIGTGGPAPETPPRDRVLSKPKQALPRGNDIERGVETIVIPTPPRAVLSCAAAVARAASIVCEDLAPPSTRGRSATRVNYEPLPVRDASATIMMGVDYKRFRRAEAAAKRDTAGVRAYSSVHLAEWVVVVQGNDPAANSVPWEIVFDGSSSPGSPRMQCVRVHRSFMALNPRLPDVYEHALLAEHPFGRVPAPQSVNKFITH